MTRELALALGLAAAAGIGEAAAGSPHTAVTYGLGVLTGAFVGLALRRRPP